MRENEYAEVGLGTRVGVRAAEGGGGRSSRREARSHASEGRAREEGTRARGEGGGQREEQRAQWGSRHTYTSEEDEYAVPARACSSARTLACMCSSASTDEVGPRDSTPIYPARSTRARRRYAQVDCTRAEVHEAALRWRMLDSVGNEELHCVRGKIQLRLEEFPIGAKRDRNRKQDRSNINTNKSVQYCCV
jgi:hypothetical protein